MLSLQEVSYKTPPPRCVAVYDKISLEIPYGENTIILGDNGSGKTTLMKMIMGFIAPSAGTVEGGCDKVVGVFENYDDQLFFSTVFEEFSSMEYSQKDYSAVLAALDLKGIVERSTFELSYSQKARLIVALAYLSGREFMLIDSPPQDKMINSLLSDIVMKKSRTIVLMLPRDTQELPSGKWQRYMISGRKLVKTDDDQ
ncbi:MAG: ATP-binding cassette domain-containing protein [Elusimicrobiota bacterium]